MAKRADKDETNAERKARMERELAKTISELNEFEIQVIANSCSEHFRKRIEESKLYILKCVSLASGAPEHGVKPDPEQLERINHSKVHLGISEKALAFFELLHTYGMVVEAPRMVAAIKAANGTLRPPEPKKADARVVAPKAIEPQES